MAMVNVNIRMDKDLKTRFEEFCKNIGMTMSTAVSVFARESVEERRIPFTIKEHVDPFYSDSNMKFLMKNIRSMNNGEGVVHKTIEELEAMENE